jgi:hypothetical protein
MVALEGTVPGFWQMHTLSSLSRRISGVPELAAGSCSDRGIGGVAERPQAPSQL